MREFINMDPQKQAFIDAKRKEIYDRVMAISTSPTAPPPVIPISQPIFKPEPIPAQPGPITPQSNTPPDPSPQSYFQPDPIPESTIIANNANTTPTQNINAQSKKRRWPWILAAFVIVAFLLGYAIFWVKVFGVEIPFLSSFF